MKESYVESVTNNYKGVLLRFFFSSQCCSSKSSGGKKNLNQTPKQNRTCSWDRIPVPAPQVGRDKLQPPRFFNWILKCWLKCKRTNLNKECSYIYIKQQDKVSHDGETFVSFSYFLIFWPSSVHFQWFLIHWYSPSKWELDSFLLLTFLSIVKTGF